ncbi:MAG: N-alpha-acetyl diaminobutyric acid deacetylase DoeB [Oceanospirillaceae bacterium]|jgi:N-alpha-acetyl-L-2,4-diaminobutyrate deacetylase|nr:N-alpha-acetyl diaminobutyric acid deacetylase DoeB [Oceanospirillaceae bacterium]MBT7673283.1 N-alpha-acetyl diaminobutyric acid deacetylase DoeB [Oceanospirillaceae bacterium]HAW17923.1 N-alpha-acetyl diaminobutyric acid deacetylase DoeB [Oceanospirillaceae bacterium]
MGSEPLPSTSMSATIDFESDGVQHGFLQLPYSSDRSAWGSVMIPICQIKNGHGPTALLTGGNHGDEYEGPTSLLKLANCLDVTEVQGRVIIVPMMNQPAFEAGSRTSPIDAGNMNRAFPGHPYGTLTERIADYFSRVLVPMCDYALDIHSGGKTLDIIPFAAAHRLHNKTQAQACMTGALLFGAPYTVLMVEMDPAQLYDTAVENQGKVFVTTELRGGGTTTPATMEIADRGVQNFLKYTGIIAGEPELPQVTQLLDMQNESCYHVSHDQGVLELKVALGEQVRQGDLIASIHNHKRTGTAACHYYAAMDGIVLGRRHTPLTEIGDTIVVLASVLGDAKD